MDSVIPAALDGVVCKYIHLFKTLRKVVPMLLPSLNEPRIIVGEALKHSFVNILVNHSTSQKSIFGWGRKHHARQKWTVDKCLMRVVPVWVSQRGGGGHKETSEERFKVKRGGGGSQKGEWALWDKKWNKRGKSFWKRGEMFYRKWSKGRLGQRTDQGF